MVVEFYGSPGSLQARLGSAGGGPSDGLTGWPE